MKVWIYESQAGELMLFSKKPEFNFVMYSMQNYYERGFVDIPIEQPKKTVKKEFTVDGIDFSGHVMNGCVRCFVPCILPTNAKNVKIAYEVEE